MKLSKVKPFSYEWLILPYASSGDCPAYFSLNNHHYSSVRPIRVKIESLRTKSSAATVAHSRLEILTLDNLNVKTN